MKSKKTLILTIVIPIVLIVAAIVIMFIFFKGPSDPSLDGRIPVERVDASNPPGFYENPFNLILKPKEDGSIIKYTLDGSVPTLTSATYDKPIEINSASTDDPVSVTIVRAAAFKNDKIEGDVSTYTYVVCPKNRYTLPVVSLVTDEANLYDERIGIFASTGVKGKEWERPIHVEIFEPDGTLEISQDAGIRVYLGTMKNDTPKSLRLYARKEYFMDGRFNYKVFPDYRGVMNNKALVGSYNSLLLRNPADDWGSSMLRDSLIQRISRPLGLDYQEYRPAIIYLNGQYYGMLDIREDMNEDYIQSHYGITREYVAIVNTVTNSDGSNSYGIDTGTVTELKDFNNMLDFIINQDMKDSNRYNQATQLLDIENFVKYMATQIYTGNSEWPNNNVKAWKYIGVDANVNAPYGFDGRWRFVLKNTDSGLGLKNGWDSDSLALALNGNNLKLASVLSKLLENKSFKEQFVQCFCDIINEAANEESVISLIDNMKATISPEIKFTFKKFNLGEITKWDSNITLIREYIQKRPDAMLAFIEKDLSSLGADLGSSLAKSNMSILTIKKPTNGSIIVNTVNLFDTAKGKGLDKFTGKYFNNIPFNIISTPDYGYELKGYDITGSIEMVNGKFILKGDATLQPVFALKTNLDKKLLVINEINASPLLKNETNWVELYNASNEPIDLNGYYLSDDLTFLNKWQISNVTIQPGKYYTIYCTLTGEGVPSGQPYANFSIGDNETVTLSKPDGNTKVDSMNVGYCERGVSIGRYPNAEGPFKTLNEPSLGKDNVYRDYIFSFK